MLLVLQQNMLLGEAPVLVEVPDVVGETQAAGTATLEGVAFVVAVQTAYSSTVAAGLIIEQSPAAGIEAVEGSTVTITVSLGAQTAGGISRKRRRLYVEIDGQQFDVESVQHAQALLERAKALAPQAAEEAAERAASSVQRVKVTKVPRVEVKAPSITASPDLSIDLTDIRKQLDRVYAEAAMALEMRMLLQRQAEQDEEEAIFLLM